MRIAMWSGPRNLSTAMMYAFGNRPDCEAWDEPFYAAYLEATGADHPMREACMAAQPTDPAKVVETIADPKKPVQYLKLMTHHMAPGFPVDWAQNCTNVHLIRHPARVIASYGKKRANITMDDIGFADVDRIFTALPGPIVDSADIRSDPRLMLGYLCDSIGLEFSAAMLHWPAGAKSFDGAWAPHWYDAVHRSTGFAGPEGDLPEIDETHRPLLNAALPIYEAMWNKRLRP